MQNNDRKTEQIPLRVTPEQKRIIQQLAREEDRSVSSYLLHLAKQAAKEKGLV